MNDEWEWNRIRSLTTCKQFNLFVFNHIVWFAPTNRIAWPECRLLRPPSSRFHTQIFSMVRKPHALHDSSPIRTHAQTFHSHTSVRSSHRCIVAIAIALANCRRDTRTHTVAVANAYIRKGECTNALFTDKPKSRCNLDFNTSRVLLVYNKQSTCRCLVVCCVERNSLDARTRERAPNRKQENTYLFSQLLCTRRINICASRLHVSRVLILHSVGVVCGRSSVAQTKFEIKFSIRIFFFFRIFRECGRVFFAMW